MNVQMIYFFNKDSPNLSSLLSDILDTSLLLSLPLDFTYLEFCRLGSRVFAKFLEPSLSTTERA